MGAENTGNRFEILDVIKELPSLPQVLVGISRVANNPKSSTNALADIILHDQALTLRILRIANSAQYAMYAQRITTVSKAVVLLGFQSVRAIALGAETFRLLSQLTKAGEVLERFWKDAVAVAVASQELGALTGIETVEEAFVAGLLHDVGKLVIAQYDPDGARQLYERNLTERELMLEETRLYGVNHTELGGELARRWQLPPEISLAMEHHHRYYSRPPAGGGEQLAFIVAAAKAIVNPRYNEERLQRELASGMARILLKPVGSVLALVQRLPQQIAEYAEFFDLQIDDLKVYTLWVEEENQRLSRSAGERETGRRETERREAFLNGIRELHGLLLGQKGVDALARKIVQTAQGVIGAKRAVVLCLDQDRRLTEGMWHEGEAGKDFLENFRETPFDNGIVTQAVRDRSALNVLDAKIPYFRDLLNRREKAILENLSFLILPVVLNSRTVALLYADRDNDETPFGDAETADMQTLADILALALKG